MDRALRDFSAENNLDEITRRLSESKGLWRFYVEPKHNFLDYSYLCYEYTGSSLKHSTLFVLVKSDAIYLANIVPGIKSGTTSLTDHQYNQLADDFIRTYNLSELGFSVKNSLEDQGITGEYVANLAHYEDIVATISNGHSISLYRGQGNANWDITPSVLVNYPVSRPNYKTDRLDISGIYEIEDQITSLLAWERSLFDSFISEIQPFYCGLNNRSLLGKMVIARHFGLPSRLVDWSHDSLVSLFFACSSEPKLDGCVWVALPDEADLLSHTRYTSHPLLPVRVVGQGNATHRTSFILDAPSLTLNHASQQGVFSIHPIERTDYAPINKVFPPSKFKKILISAKNKQFILDQLRAMHHVSRHSIYPSPSLLEYAAEKSIFHSNQEIRERDPFELLI